MKLANANVKSRVAGKIAGSPASLDDSEMLASEKTTMMTATKRCNFYPALLRELGERNVAYVLLRDHPEADGLSDLDVLVEASQLDEFAACCHRHGFRLMKNGRWNPGKQVWLRWDADGKHVIDLHERMVFRGLEYLNAGTILQRRRTEGGYSFLSTEDELLTLLFHNVLGKRQIQPKHRARLEQLLAQRLDETYLAEHLRQYGLGTVFTQIREHFNELADDAGAMRQLHREAIHSLKRKSPANAFAQRRMRCRATLARWVGPRRGSLVVFLGPDGCGKSSTIQALRRQFRGATLATDIAYLGPWGQSRLPLQKLVSALHLKPYRPEEKARFRGKHSSAGDDSWLADLSFGVKGTLFYAALAVELWFRFLVLVLPNLRRGRVVLGDRYIYDILIGYKNRPTQYFSRLRAMLCRLYPKPDMTILLDAPPEIIHARKPQLDVVQLADISARYRTLGNRLGFHQLDTSVNLDATLQQFQRELLPHILREWNP